jgi:hypothetical protein
MGYELDWQAATKVDEVRPKVDEVRPKADEVPPNVAFSLPYIIEHR